NGTIEFASRSCAHTLGYLPEELVGRPFNDLVHPEEGREAAEAFAQLLRESGSERKAEYRFRAKSGSWCWMESLHKNLLANPAIGSVIVSARDITPRKRAQLEGQVLVDVIRALNATPKLDELLVRIHQSLRKVLYAEN